MGFPVVLSFGLTRFAWSQLTYTVPVVDKSDPGSPLKISGTASFTELIVSNSVRSSHSFRVGARNLSEKGILLLHAFDEAGPHGGGTRQVIQIDHFFWGQIGPGDSFVLARKRPEGQTSACCVTPLVPADEPKADVRVQYFQFTDGSTFGEETTAKDILSTRLAILDALWRLDSAANNESFLALLTEKVQPDDADRFFETFRRTQKHDGTAAARSQVHTGVTAAQAHAAALRAVQAADTTTYRICSRRNSPH
jgi:hypothetical protein